MYAEGVSRAAVFVAEVGGQDFIFAVRYARGRVFVVVPVFLIHKIPSDGFIHEAAVFLGHGGGGEGPSVAVPFELEHFHAGVQHAVQPYSHGIQFHGDVLPCAQLTDFTDGGDGEGHVRRRLEGRQGVGIVATEFLLHLFKVFLVLYPTFISIVFEIEVGSRVVLEHGLLAIVRL